MAICVQVTPPLDDHAATLDGPLATAIKYVVAPIVPPATPLQFVGPAGNDPPADQSVPLAEKPLVDPLAVTATNRPLTTAVLDQVALLGNEVAADANEGIGCELIDDNIEAPGTSP